MKTCTKCKTEKDFSEFHFDRYNKDKCHSKCKVCRNNERNTYHQNNKEVEILKSKEWNKNNPDRVKINNKTWKEENREHLDSYQKEWKDNNVDKTRTASKKWKKNNRDKCNADYNRYRAKKLNATLDLSEDQNILIEKFYEESARLTKETGIPHDVDHIVPLRGKTISGLHVPWNLRVVTAEENRKKGNKLIT